MCCDNIRDLHSHIWMRSFKANVSHVPCVFPLLLVPSPSYESNCGLSNDLRNKCRHPGLVWGLMTPELLPSFLCTNTRFLRLSVTEAECLIAYLLLLSACTMVLSADYCYFPSFLSQGDQGDIGPRVSLVFCP